jgi:hypothetical protein
VIAHQFQSDCVAIALLKKMRDDSETFAKRFYGDSTAIVQRLLNDCATIMN